MSNEEQLSLDDLLGFVPSAFPSKMVKPKLTSEQAAYNQAQKILIGWSGKGGRTKTFTKQVTQWFVECLLNNVSPQHLNYVITQRSLLANRKSFTQEELDEALCRVEFDKTAHRLTSGWAKKSGRTQETISNVIYLFADRLMHGVLEDDLKYVLLQRTLLASHKIITPDILDSALQGVEKDRAAGSQAKEIFDVWYERWYRNRYVQKPAEIMPVIKGALLNGNDPETVKIAMNDLGSTRQVISTRTIQYSIDRALREYKRNKDSGAHGAVMVNRDIQRQIFRDHRQSVGLSHKEESPF